MLKVWAALGLSMIAASILCGMAMPAPNPPLPGSGAGGPGDLAAVDSLIWTTDMPAERPWRFLVVHHSATVGGTLESIDRGHADRGFANGIGYHFLINNGRSAGTADGEIAPTPRWREQIAGAHCKVTEHPEFNTEGIGICLIGDFDLNVPTPAQMTSLEILIQRLQRRYGIPLERVIAHGELKNTQCPGRRFPLETLIMDLRQMYLKTRILTPSPVPMADTRRSKETAG